MKTLRESILTSIGQGDQWFEKQRLKDWELDPEKAIIHSDGSVDYMGDVSFENKNIEKLPIHFNRVTGCFNVRHCRKLKTLEGSPKWVGGWFGCIDCRKIETMEGAPLEVGDWFSCAQCEKLKTLKGGPKKVGGSFFCSFCREIEDMEGSPEEIGGDFYCPGCTNLKTLQGITPHIKGDLQCQGCKNLNSIGKTLEKIDRRFLGGGIGREITKEEIMSRVDVGDIIYLTKRR